MICPFCSINKRGPQRQGILEERSLVYAKASNPRLMHGHLLAIPIRHIELPWELEPEERQQIFDTILNLQQKIMATEDDMGCDVRQHCRPFLPEDVCKVNHVHYHVMPRRLNDYLYQQVQIFEKDVFEKLSPQKMRWETKRLDTMLYF